MDIDDILASVSGPASSSHEAADLQALTRAWVNEKCAPELLHWPGELMDRVLERVRKQIELVEEQTGDMDPAINFRLIIQQTELERFKFVIRSLLRTRLAKLDQHAQHYLGEAKAEASSLSHSSSSPTLLSPHELQYATRHQALLAAHYDASFLSAFPAQLQRLDDTAGGISMVEGPDRDLAVFVRALVDSGEAVWVEGTDIDFDLVRGGIYVVRWSAVSERVRKGEVELV